MVTQLHISATTEALYIEVARALRVSAAAAIERCGHFLLGLSGGQTPRPLFRLLAATAAGQDILRNGTDYFWSDERTVSPEDPNSNYAVAQRDLLRPLGVAAQRIHRIRAELADSEEAAREYERQLQRWVDGAAGSEGLFDLVLLGIGEDGHTASLFPNTQALVASERAVVANKVPQLQTTRITLTAPRLNRSRQILFVVSGEQKAAALAAILEGQRQPLRYPAQLIDSIHGTVHWYVDAAAAALLKQSG